MRFTLTANQRIHRSSVFQHALRVQGKSNKWFTIYLIDSKQNYARLGMIVSKRVIPLAVTRNYTKRLIREIFRQNSGNLPHLDFIIRVRRNFYKNFTEDAKLALVELMLNAKTA